MTINARLIQIVLVILAILIAAAVLLGVDLGSLTPVKADALATILLAVAICL